MRNSFAVCVLLLLLSAVPVRAQLAGTDTSPGSSCAGTPAGAVLLTADADGNGAEVVLVCDGTVWKPTQLQAGNDTGACNGTKTGRLRYASATDTWEYCTGSAWSPFKEPCADNGTGACWLDATRSNGDPEFLATNIRDGINILGITGNYTGAAWPPDCTNDSAVQCVLEATRANDDPQFVAGNIRTGVNILSVTGSLANCANDATGECILNATRNNSDPQFTAANIASGINVLGVTGTYDNRAPDCTNDSSITCTLEATRANDDAQFVPANIRTGANILNVTGSLANCANDATGECILHATRSNSDGQFLAANIADGVNILGITGTFTGTGCTITWDTPPDVVQASEGVATSSDIELITTGGCSPDVTISGAGSPQYRICSAADCSTVPHTWTSGTTAIDSGEYIQTRLTAASTPGTQRTATLSVGSSATDWSVTTANLPEYIASTTFTDSWPGPEIATINKPAGTQQNDLMIATMAMEDKDIDMTAPAGWTELRDINTGSSSRTAIFYKVAGSSEPSSYDFDFNSDEWKTLSIVTIRNVDTANPIDVNATNTGDSDQPTAASITTTVNDTLLVAIPHITKGSTFTAPSGYTEHVDVQSSVRVGHSVATKLQSASGASGTAVFDTSGSADDWRTEHIAVQPP